MTRIQELNDSLADVLVGRRITSAEYIPVSDNSSPPSLILVLDNGYCVAVCSDGEFDSPGTLGVFETPESDKVVASFPPVTCEDVTPEDLE